MAQLASRPRSAYIDGTMTGYAFGTDGRAINASESHMRPVAMHAFDQVGHTPSV